MFKVTRNQITDKASKVTSAITIVEQVLEFSTPAFIDQL